MNLDIENLKKKLIDNGLCVDNEFLDKYCLLIINNKSTPKEKFKTHKHHIIPKLFYKMNKLPIDNSENNVVNLSYQEHVLAHCYLEMCLGSTTLKAKNYWGIIQLSHTYFPYDELQEVIKNADRLEEIISQLRGLEKFSEEHRKHLSEAMRGNHNFGSGDTRSVGVGCVLLDTGEKFEFHSIKEAGLWWYNTLHPFGERYAECTFQRKIKKSINGEKISYDINHDSNSKHLNKEDIVEITNIKWYKL